MSQVCSRAAQLDLGAGCWPVKGPLCAGDQSEGSRLPTPLGPGRSPEAAQAGSGSAVPALPCPALPPASGSLLTRCTPSFAPFRVGLVGCLNSLSSPEFPEASPCAARTLGGLKHRLGSALLAAAGVHSLFLVGSLIQTSG